MLFLLYQIPALSFLFSGDRDGPDGYHPRLDELYPDAHARISAIHSLVDVGRADDADWPFIQRALLGITSDRVGGSHQVEVCFDKLWSAVPERNLGVVELRMFEMYATANGTTRQLALACALANFCCRQDFPKRIRRRERVNSDVMERDVICALQSISDDRSLVESVKYLAKARYPDVWGDVRGLREIRVRSARTLWLSNHTMVREGSLLPLFIPRQIACAIEISQSQRRFFTATLDMSKSFASLFKIAPVIGADKCLDASIDVLMQNIVAAWRDIEPESVSFEQLVHRLRLYLHKKTVAFSLCEFELNAEIALLAHDPPIDA
jgi:hypothetical protein